MIGVLPSQQFVRGPPQVVSAQLGEKSRASEVPTTLIKDEVAQRIYLPLPERRLTIDLKAGERGLEVPLEIGFALFGSDGSCERSDAVGVPPSVRPHVAGATVGEGAESFRVFNKLHTVIGELHV